MNTQQQESKPAPGLLSTLLFGRFGERGAAGQARMLPLDVPLAFARVYAGWMIMTAGFDKLPTPGWMVDQVVEMGFPFPSFSATAACLTEFVCGLLLMVGLFTRFSAFALAVVIGFACFRFHGMRPIVDFHITQFYFALFLCFLAVGSGRVSLDFLFARVAQRKLLPAVLTALVLAAAPLGYGLSLELFGERAPAPDEEASLGINTLSISGTFNGWDLEADPMTSIDEGLWQGTISIESPGLIEFKFAANGGWALNLGENDDLPADLPLTGAGDPNGNNIRFVAPAPGRYLVRVAERDGAYSVEAIPPDPAGAGSSE